MLYNNQQDVQAAGEDAKIQVTTWYLLLHTYALGFILGIKDADWASMFLGSCVFKRCLERLSLLSALWLRLDSALTFPRFQLWCLGFPVVPFPCLACELGSTWSTPPWSRSRSKIDAGCWVGNVTSMAGCAWWSYTLLIGGAEEASK